MASDYLAQTWRDSRQDIRPSPIGGMGIFTWEMIKAGEPVERVGGHVMTEQEFREFQRVTLRYNAIQIDENLHLVEIPEITQQRVGSINHSCDSNLWMADAVTVVARRDILPDEELTVDYALFTAQDDWILDANCNCGTPVCRHIIRGHDWQRPDVQQRYYPHFSPFLNHRIHRIQHPTSNF